MRKGKKVRRRKLRPQPRSLEAQYKVVFVPETSTSLEAQVTLEQPEAVRIVRTVTTYGAYQEPV